MKLFILLATITVGYSSQDTTSEKPWDSPFERAAGGASNTMAAGSAAYNSPQPQVSPFIMILNLGYFAVLPDLG